MDNFFGTAPFVCAIEHEIIEKLAYCVLYAQYSNMRGGQSWQVRSLTAHVHMVCDQS